ncbi:MAG: hypothetical protein GY724_28235, partial [Actinomycetia bacterium]|nr:hypothetical protein [Actinomycetes bacterium]
KDEGIPKTEIEDVKAIVMAVAAGQMRAQYSEARLRQLKSERKEGEAAESQE